jgi:hypothetical protein
MMHQLAVSAGQFQQAGNPLLPAQQPHLSAREIWNDLFVLVVKSYWLPTPLAISIRTLPPCSQGVSHEVCRHCAVSVFCRLYVPQAACLPACLPLPPPLQGRWRTQDVAVKVIHCSPRDLDSVLREADVMMKLQHEFVVKCFSCHVKEHNPGRAAASGPAARGVIGSAEVRKGGLELSASMLLPSCLAVYVADELA